MLHLPRPVLYSARERPLKPGQAIHPMDSKQLQFGEFVLDCARYELRRGDRPVKLEKIPMELLILLAASDGRLVTREEIEERVWGKGVFVDAEHGINTAVRKIRQALGDDPDKPKFVQTVQRKGYRFVAKLATGAVGPLQGATDASPQAVTRPPDIPTTGHSLEANRAIPAADGRTTKTRQLRWAAVVTFALLFLLLATVKLAPKLKRPENNTAPIHSLAVLPLENISGDADQEFFADGITDELITMLAKYPSLRVISRTSVMQYKKARKPLPEIARELGVDGVVEGTVLRSQGRVRVTAQLIYAPTDTHIWAETYDRDLEDVLRLQQELASSIAERVQAVSSLVKNSETRSQPSVNVAARDLYFRGKYFWFLGEWEKSRDLFQQAIKLDPSYAAAYAGLADSYTLGNADGAARPSDVMPLAEAAVHKALDLDDSLAEGHHALAAIKFFYEWDFDGAERESQRALELNPGFAEAHHLHAYILSAQNRMVESLAEDKRTNELDPFARPWVYGYALIRARRYSEAVAELKLRLAARPDSLIIHGTLADAYAYQGDYKNAVEELKKTRLLAEEPQQALTIGKDFEKGGYPAVYQRFLDHLKENAAKTYTPALQMAEAAVWAGHHGEAIRYLQQAYQDREAWMGHLQHIPALDPLHSDPRYQEIVKKVGLKLLQ